MAKENKAIDADKYLKLLSKTDVHSGQSKGPGLMDLPWGMDLDWDKDSGKFSVEFKYFNQTPVSSHRQEKLTLGVAQLSEENQIVSVTLSQVRNVSEVLAALTFSQPLEQDERVRQVKLILKEELA